MVWNVNLILSPGRSTLRSCGCPTEARWKWILARSLDSRTSLALADYCLIRTVSTPRLIRNRKQRATAGPGSGAGFTAKD